eukprot:962791-Pyramimonas_sp.AAC.1
MPRSSPQVGPQVRRLGNCTNLKSVGAHSPGDDFGVVQLRADDRALGGDGQPRSLLRAAGVDKAPH